MMTFAVFFILLLATWWSFSWALRTALWKEWTAESRGVFLQFFEALQHQLRTLSPQNAVAQGLVDFELKSKSLMQSLMLVTLSRVGTWALVILLLCVRNLSIFTGAIILGSLIFMAAFKKPTRWIQVALLSAVFFGLYDWTFRKAGEFVFRNSLDHDIALFLGDGRLSHILILGLASLLITLLLRMEFWSVILSSILFLVGAIPITTAMVILICENLGWAVYWYLGGRKCSQVSGRLFLERLVITGLAAVAMVFLLLILRGAGWLHIGISGTLEERKLYFLMGWILWEITVSVVWAIWGHFRARSRIIESSDLSPISIPPALLGAKWWGYKGWLPVQTQNRLKKVRKRKEKLETQLSSLTEEEKLRFPPGFLNKTHQEVESLKRLLGALPSDSV